MTAKIILISLGFLTYAAAQNDRPNISRLLLQDTPPRSIAIGYQHGFNAVFNSINLTPLYVWQGGFINDKNETNGRGGGACSIGGARVQLDLPIAPLRINDAKTRPETITFKGYDRPVGKPPVFHAEIDQLPVSFTIASESGHLVRLRYEFSQPLEHPAYFLTGMRPVDQIAIDKPLSWKDGIVTIPQGQKSFTIQLNLTGEKGVVVKAKKLSGKELYAAHCSACHSLTGQKLIGPSFKALFGKKETVLSGGAAGKQRQITVDDAYLRSSILNPQQDVVVGFATAPMPSYKDVLQSDEIDRLIEYIKQQK